MVSFWICFESKAKRVSWGEGVVYGRRERAAVGDSRMLSGHNCKAGATLLRLGKTAVGLVVRGQGLETGDSGLALLPLRCLSDTPVAL